MSKDFENTLQQFLLSVDNQRNKSPAPSPAIRSQSTIKQIQLNELVFSAFFFKLQCKCSNTVPLVYFPVYLGKGLPVIVCRSNIHILFVGYPDFCMQNAGSPPILKKYGYILNVWPSCSEVSTLLVEIRSKSSVLRDPAKMIRSLTK